jgi:hypothetical protein
MERMLGRRANPFTLLAFAVSRIPGIATATCAAAR